MIDRQIEVALACSQQEKLGTIDTASQEGCSFFCASPTGYRCQAQDTTLPGASEKDALEKTALLARLSIIRAK